MHKTKRIPLLILIAFMFLSLVACDNTNSNSISIDTNKSTELSVGEIIEKTQKALKTTSHITITKERPLGTDVYIINNENYELYWSSVNMDWGDKNTSDNYIVRNPEQMGTFLYYIDHKSYTGNEIKFSYCSRSLQTTTDLFYSICEDILMPYWEREHFLSVNTDRENINGAEYYVLEGTIPNHDGKGNIAHMKFLINTKTFLLYSFNLTSINPDNQETQGYLKVTVNAENKPIQIPDKVIHQAEIEENEDKKDIVDEGNKKLRPFSDSGPMFTAEKIKIKIGDSAFKMLNHSYQEYDIKYMAQLSNHDYKKNPNCTKDTLIQPNEVVLIELSSQTHACEECVVGIVNLSNQPLPVSECTIGYLIYHNFDYIANQNSTYTTIVSELKTLLGSQYTAESISDSNPWVVMHWNKKEYNAIALRDEIFTHLFIARHPHAPKQLENILIQELIDNAT